MANDNSIGRTTTIRGSVYRRRYQLAIHSLAGDPPPPELQSEPLWM